MFDIAALEEAGFEKTLSDEEWERMSANVIPLVDYRLVRGDIMISTEQNTQQTDASGLQTTVRYPEIAVIQHLARPDRRVSCDASDTELILLLVAELDQDSRPRGNTREGINNG